MNARHHWVNEGYVSLMLKNYCKLNGGGQQTETFKLGERGLQNDPLTQRGQLWKLWCDTHTHTALTNFPVIIYLGGGCASMTSNSSYISSSPSSLPILPVVELRRSSHTSTPPSPSLTPLHLPPSFLFCPVCSSPTGKHFITPQGEP